MALASAPMAKLRAFTRASLLAANVSDIDPHPFRHLPLRDLGAAKPHPSRTDVVGIQEDFFDWIMKGPPGTPRTPKQEDSRLQSPKTGGPRPSLKAGSTSQPNMRGSTSLPNIPRRSTLAPAAAAPTAAKPAKKKSPPGPASMRGSSRNLLGNVPAGAPDGASPGGLHGSGKGHKKQRGFLTKHQEKAQQSMHKSTAQTLGLDTSSSWKYSGKLSTFPEFAKITRQAMYRHKQMLDDLEEVLALERVPTPQHAAGRELVPNLGLPEMPGEATLHPMQYIQPSSAVIARMPHYLYHEPGEKVRESLLVLEHLRRSHRGGGKYGTYAQLEKRHHERMVAAHANAEALHEHHDRTEMAYHAAGRVQNAWRERAAAPSPPPDASPTAKRKPKPLRRTA